MDPTVIAAVIGGLFTLFGGYLGREVRRGRRDTKKAIDNLGSPNGHGTLANMMETMLTQQSTTDRRLANQDDLLAAHGQQLETLARAVVRIDRRLAKQQSDK